MFRLAAALQSLRVSRCAGLVVAVAMLFSAAAACAEPQAAACSKTYAPQTLENTEPLNLGQLKNQLYFYACSGPMTAT